MWVIAICSFLFHKCVKGFVSLAMRLNRRRFSNEGRKWIPAAKLLSNRPFRIFLSCFFAPRWNCHATLANLGPFRAERLIRVNTETLSAADSWTLVMYDHEFRTITASHLNDTENWQEFSVSPGYFSIVFRYYGRDLDMYTPSVFVDGQLLTEARKFVNEKKLFHEFFESIQGKKTFFYFLLQYHAFYLLRYPDFFPTKWVRKGFRPVPNPETVYFQGYLAKRSSINVRCEPKIFEKALVYITVFNEASFPEIWEQVQHEDFSLTEMKRAGGYLIRIVAKRNSTISLNEATDMIQIAIVA